MNSSHFFIRKDLDINYLKSSVTQLHQLGCGAACVAFVTKKDYQNVAILLGEAGADVHGYFCRELTSGLEKLGFSYLYKHITSLNRKLIYKTGVIVFIRRSKKYPSGHYLVRHHNFWMDPWLNFPKNHNLTQAISGFRKKLPGEPIYALIPI